MRYKQTTMYVKLILLGFLFFIGHQVAQKIFNVQLPFLDNYLDPFLGVVLALFLHEKNPFRRTKLDYLEIIVGGILFAFLSEYLFPNLAPDRFVADYLDLVAILLGTITFGYMYKHK